MPDLGDIMARLDRLERGLTGLCSVQEIAAWASCSARTVKRTCRREDIPVRNIHGGRWTEGDGPQRIHAQEWRERREKDRRSLAH